MNKMNKISIITTLLFACRYILLASANNEANIVVLVAQGTPDLQIQEGESMTFIVDPKTTIVGQLLKNFVDDRKFYDKEGNIPLEIENLNLVTYDNNYRFYPIDLTQTLEQAGIKQLSILRVQNKSDNLNAF